MARDMVNLGFEVSKDLNDWLDEESSERGLSKSEFCRLLLKGMRDQAIEIEFRGPTLGLKWDSSSAENSDSREEKKEE